MGDANARSGGVRTIELLLEARNENGWTVLEAKGEIDLFTAPKLRERIVQLVDDRQHRIVVDLEGVEFMDSTGLGVLVGALKRLREQDGSLRLVCTRAPILRILSITGLDQVFDVRESAGQAAAD